MNGFIEYLNEQQQICLKRADVLADDQRDDESSLEKIRANIYGIFHTLAKSPIKSTNFITEKLEQIPAAWHDSLAKAIEHNDHQKEAQERIKLAVVEDIKEKLASIMEGENNE